MLLSIILALVGDEVEKSQLLAQGDPWVASRAPASHRVHSSTTGLGSFLPRSDGGSLLGWRRNGVQEQDQDPKKDSGQPWG